MHHYFLTHAFYKVPLIKESPDPDLSIIVVIPALAEAHLITTLNDLSSCAFASASAFFSTEVIVVINHSEDSNNEICEINETTFYKSVEWSALHSSPERRYHILYQPDLSRKKAGVGLARKIGMDEAARRFAVLNRPHGVILSLDADCHVEKNYLMEVEKFFIDNPRIEGCSIAFEHPLEGLSDAHRKVIIDYEMHLRYFIGMQRWAGCPYAFQTIGSAMAVRAGVYCKVGGMNMRQAGEDFYFLHKVIARGAFAELTSTTVYPSPRVSDRVPFGTGRAMTTALEGAPLTTYNPQSFIDLKAFIDVVPELYAFKGDLQNFFIQRDISLCVMHFLQENHFDKKLAELQSNTASQRSFMKRFFHWFDAFLLMKYVHYARDGWYGNVEVGEAVNTSQKISGSARIGQG
ncbi:MAG TPA: hypothetical protein VI603_09525 [Saprospiraceae bacterium]|nr:hypothetical protein [Saprospiraceae bacterium]